MRTHNNTQKQQKHCGAYGHAKYCFRKPTWCKPKQSWFHVKTWQCACESMLLFAKIYIYIHIHHHSYFNKNHKTLTWIFNPAPRRPIEIHVSERICVFFNTWAATSFNTHEIFETRMRAVNRSTMVPARRTCRDGQPDIKQVYQAKRAKQNNTSKKSTTRYWNQFTGSIRNYKDNSHKPERTETPTISSKTNRNARNIRNNFPKRTNKPELKTNATNSRKKRNRRTLRYNHSNTFTATENLPYKIQTRRTKTHECTKHMRSEN